MSSIEEVVFLADVGGEHGLGVVPGLLDGLLVLDAPEVQVVPVLRLTPHQRADRDLPRRLLPAPLQQRIFQSRALQRDRASLESLAVTVQRLPSFIMFVPRPRQ